MFIGGAAGSHFQRMQDNLGELHCAQHHLSSFHHATSAANAGDGCRRFG